MHVYNPKRKVPTPDRSASARRSAPAARGPVLTTLISALRRRRTSSCAARYARFMRVADSSFLSRTLCRTLCAPRTAPEIRNEYRDYRRPRGIISRSRYSLPLEATSVLASCDSSPTTRFMFSRICIRINLDEATRNMFHSCDRPYRIC